MAYETKHQKAVNCLKLYIKAMSKNGKSCKITTQEKHALMRRIFLETGMRIDKIYEIYDAFLKEGYFEEVVEK